MGSYLRTVPGPNERLYFFPIFTKELNSYINYACTQDKLLMLLFCPPAVDGGISFIFIAHFLNLLFGI
jgi:hypothetical protein